MAPKDLGTKHTCFKCSTKFYDLKKAAPICPKCGADQRESPALKPAPERRSRAAPRPVEPVEEVEPIEDVDEDVEDDEDDVAPEGDDDDA